jgi:hypothetical protein
VKLFVIVFFDRRHLLSDAGQLAYLVLDLVLKETHLIFKVVDAQVLEHDDVVISVLTKQALEANGAQVILAKGLYLFCGVYLAPTFLELTNLIVVHDIFECVTLSLLVALFFMQFKLYIIIIIKRIIINLKIRLCNLIGGSRSPLTILKSHSEKSR